jgi:hypothetical protein
LDKACKKSKNVQVKFINNSIINMIYNNPEDVVKAIVDPLGSEQSSAFDDGEDIFLNPPMSDRNIKAQPLPTE